jgi:hypothetical protein
MASRECLFVYISRLQSTTNRTKRGKHTALSLSLLLIHLKSYLQHKLHLLSVVHTATTALLVWFKFPFHRRPSLSTSWNKQ